MGETGRITNDDLSDKWRGARTGSAGGMEVEALALTAAGTRFSLSDGGGAAVRSFHLPMLLQNTQESVLLLHWNDLCSHRFP